MRWALRFLNKNPRDFSFEALAKEESGDPERYDG